MNLTDNGNTNHVGGTTAYMIFDGGLNSKMATNHDVIESSAVNGVTSLEGIYDEINGTREVYRNNSCPLPSAHYSVWDTHPDLPISNLGGREHTTAFHKSSKTNRQKALKHL